MTPSDPKPRKWPKRDPKFQVGQVVYFREWLSYVIITAKWISAEGVGRGLRWRYNVFYENTRRLNDVDERQIRKLTKKEAGR